MSKEKELNLSTIRIGTRESPLAMAQTRLIENEISKQFPEIKVEILKMKTMGDKILNTTLDKVGGKGLFIKELEQAILDGHVDIAVHSLKDVPVELAEGLEIACYTKREEAYDVLISPYKSLSEIKPRAVIGTSSSRREIQLKNIRPDITVFPIRGNVATRIKKLLDGQFNGIILAKAGLNRLGIERVEGFHLLPLDPDQMIPAIGQGIVCVESRMGDEVGKILRKINCGESQVLASCERAVLKACGGSCFTPLSAYATLNDDEITINGFLGTEDKKRSVRATLSGSAKDSEEIGTALAKMLQSRLKAHGNFKV